MNFKNGITNKTEIEILVDCKRLVEKMLQEEYAIMDCYSERCRPIPEWLIYKCKQKEYALGLIDKAPTRPNFNQ